MNRILQAHFFFDHLFVAASSESINEVLAAEARGEMVQSIPPSFRSLVGPEAVLNLDGHSHMELRRAINPAFTRSAVRAYMPLVTDLTMDQAQRWRQRSDESGGAAFPLQADIRLLHTFA